MVTVADWLYALNRKRESIDAGGETPLKR
jgi:hypothetical protein